MIKNFPACLFISLLFVVSTVLMAQELTANEREGLLFSNHKNQLTLKRKQQLTHLVKQDCGSCHGMTLKGGLGPALLPENIKDKPMLFLQNTILYGRPGTAMPPWKSLLTEQESLWISQQLKKGFENENNE